MPIEPPLDTWTVAIDADTTALELKLAEAARLGDRMPLTALVDQFYAQVVQRGGKRWDTSSLVQLLREP